MEAPQCPLCGKKEWRHVCNPKTEAKGVIRSRRVVKIETPLKGLGQAGRPRLDRSKDEKRKMRTAYMKEYRALKRAKVLGDDNKAVGIKSVPE